MGSFVRAWPYKSLQWIYIVFFSIIIQHIICYCIKGLSLQCCFPKPLWFLFLLWDCWCANISPSDKTSVQSLIRRWALRPVGLLIKNPTLTHPLPFWKKNSDKPQNKKSWPKTTNSYFCLIVKIHAYNFGFHNVLLHLTTAQLGKKDEPKKM